MTQAQVIYQKNIDDTPRYASSSRSTSTHEIKQWGLLIGLPVVGLLLLMLCFLLQGIFAAAGPWVILLGVKLIHRKVENNDAARYNKVVF